MTPRPWLPSSGLSATGKPMRRAAATAASPLRTTSERGTGTPVAASSRFVSFLSDAMSTPSDPVRLVIVARIRFWWIPWPSCTSDWSLSRIDGMSRRAASSRMACVDGPKADRSARRISASRSAAKSKSGSASTRWLTRRTASLPAATPTVSSAYEYTTWYWPGSPVPRVLPRPTSVPASRWSWRAMCSATCPTQVPSRSRSSKPPTRARSARVLPDAGQHLEQRLGEAGDRVRREVLEDAEVDDELDGRVVVPVVRPAVDTGLDDPQLRFRARAGWGAGRRPRATRASCGRACRASLAGLLVDAASAQRAPASALRCRVVGALGRDAADEAPRAVRGRLEAGELAIGGADGSQRRHELAACAGRTGSRTAASGGSRPRP